MSLDFIVNLSVPMLNARPINSELGLLRFSLENCLRQASCFANVKRELSGSNFESKELKTCQCFSV